MGRQEPAGVAIIRQVQNIAAALARRVPDIAKRLPRRLAELYEFTPDQDLLSGNARHPSLSPGELSSALTALKAGDLPSLDREILAGFARICAKRYRTAWKGLAALSRRHPHDPRCALLEGASLWLLGDQERTRRYLTEALAAADRAVALDASPSALMLRAQIRYEIEDREGGLSDLGLLLRRTPGDKAARWGRMEGYADGYRYRSAEREFKALGSRGALRWWSFAQRGRLRGMCGRLPGALRDFNEAIRRQPRRGALYAWRAEVLRRLGRYEETRADLDKCLTASPGYAYGWESSGRMRLIEGDPAAALAELGRACRLDPGRSLSFAWRGEAGLKSGDRRQAAADFDRIYPLHPRRTWNPSSLNEGDVPDAARRELSFWRDLDSAVAGAAVDPWAWLLRGKLSSAAGKLGALEDLNHAEKLCPVGDKACLAEILGWRGWTHLRSGRWAAARRDLDNSLCLSPRSALWRAWSAIACLRLGMKAQGFSALTAVMKNPQPCLAEPYFELGVELAREGEISQARRVLSLAAVMNPPFEKARAALASLEKIQGGVQS